MSEILMSDGTPAKAQVPDIKEVHPFGSSILIENLKADEIMGTSLYVQEDAETEGAPQAYIVELGPKVDDDCGLSVGDRVYVQGSFIPVINTSGNGRERGILEIHNIKGIIEEAD